MRDLLLILASFLACSVEAVEAVTIVLAVGVTRGWRAALMGVGAGLLALTAVVGILGPSLVTFVPIEGLQVVVGTLLLVFGMQWMRKAIQRAAGSRALHDEERIFQTEVRELREEGPVAQEGLDWQGFVVSFKGVFLEGLEVAFIVLSFGWNSGHFEQTLAGAIASIVLVTGIAIAIHRPLSKVPENSIKFVVGIMLVSFGTFWAGEGVGVAWKLEDVTILVLLGIYSVVAFVLLQAMKRRQALPAAQPEAAS